MSPPDRPFRHPTNNGPTSYTRALVEASGPVPYEQVDWTEFHASLPHRGG